MSDCGLVPLAFLTFVDKFDFCLNSAQSSSKSRVSGGKKGSPDTDDSPAEKKPCVRGEDDWKHAEGSAKKPIELHLSDDEPDAQLMKDLEEFTFGPTPEGKAALTRLCHEERDRIKKLSGMDVRYKNRRYKIAVGENEQVMPWYPIPHNNFPSPVKNHRRKMDLNKDVVEKVNEAYARMTCIMSKMWKDNGLPKPRQSKEMMTQIMDLLKFLNESLAKVVPLKEHWDERESPCLVRFETFDGHTRDALVQIGSGFFLCGMKLVLLGGNSKTSLQAMCTQFHLGKAFKDFNAFESVCHICGHQRCHARDRCLSYQSKPPPGFFDFYDDEGVIEDL